MIARRVAQDTSTPATKLIHTSLTDIPDADQILAESG